MESLKYYVKTIESVKNFANLESSQVLLDNLSNLHMFYYIPTNSEEENNSKEIYPLNIPFDFCWFELKQPLEVLLKGEDYTVDGFGVKEITPEYQMVYFIARREVSEGTHIISSSFSIKDSQLCIGGPEQEYLRLTSEKIYSVLKGIVNNLKKDTIHLAVNEDKINSRIRIKGKFVKIKYKPSDVIYIGSKRELNKIPELTNRIIRNKPNYAYEVMGHWRRIETVGKDRQGNRTVKGFTWVRPFIKGEGELFRKTRVVY